MNRRLSRKILISAGALLLAGWATGIVAANTTNAVSCVKPTGFSALVSAAFFAPSADCRVNTDGTCHDSAACTASNASGQPLGKGKCTNVTVNKKSTCECVVK